MNAKSLITMAGIGAVAYYLYKKTNAPKKDPGQVAHFFSEIKETIKKPLGEVANDIPQPVGTNSSTTG